MSGMLAGFTGKYATSIEYHSRALEVLEWGERTWQNVPTEQRGVIFSKTFIRGVRRMKLTSMHTVSSFFAFSRLCLHTPGYSLPLLVHFEQGG